MAVIQQKRLETEDFETAYLHAGENNAETIIFLHGSGPGANALSNWKKAIEIMGDKYHIIAPDLVGFGSTELPENQQLTFWQWTTLRVKQILSLMDHYRSRKSTFSRKLNGGLHFT